jgi:hypothetical protein
MAEQVNEFRAGNAGLVQVKTPAGVMAAQARERAESVPAKALKDNDLASFVMAVFKENEDHRRTEGVEERLLDSLRRRLGEYSPTKLAALKEQGGSVIYAELTGVKCRNGESWLADVFSPDDEKAWALRSTPVPNLPADAQTQLDTVSEKFALAKASEVMQGGQPVTPEQVKALIDETKPLLEIFVRRKLEALVGKRVRNMERLMYDQLTEGEWDRVLEQFLYDLVTFPTAILKGPIIRMRKNRRWEIAEDGTSTLVVDRQPSPVFKRVSPFDFYPAPVADCADGPGPMVEKIWFTRSALEDLKEIEGYNDAAIDRILDAQPYAASNNPDTSRDTERLELESRDDPEDVNMARDTLFGLELHGKVPGRLLIKYGLSEDNDGKKLRNAKEYSAEVITVGKETIYASVNPDKMERHPYSSTSWSKVAGSFWGRGVPELITSIQDVCNASLRALVNNMGVASGPQAILNDTDRVPEGEDVTDIYPFKIWQFTNERSITTDPVKFFTVPSNASELYVIYENFKKQADDDSGIPAYAYGNERTAGAGRTASGLSMLMTGASRGIKKVIRNVHRDVVGPSLMRLYDWNMEFVDDPEIKGDASVVPVGAVAILTREQSASRRMELLNMTNNPTDLKLIGLQNRAELLRQTFDSLEFDGDRLVLSEEELEEVVDREQQLEQQMAASQQQEAEAAAEKDQTDAQAKLEDLRIKQLESDRDYDIELRKLDAESEARDLESIAAATEAAEPEEGKTEGDQE